MPSKIKKTKEEIQTIFKMRCRVTELKTNLKGIYVTYEWQGRGDTITYT